MISRIHQKLGTAGFFIAIVALVAALCGGAYAAKGGNDGTQTATASKATKKKHSKKKTSKAGLNGTQKKEVKKISRTEAKKFVTAGPAGPAGEKGDKGDKGEKGSTGAAGPAGPTGATGATGAPGARGETGATGVPGKSPTVVAIPTGQAACEERGGAKIVGVAGEEVSVCNGEGGEGGSSETLPSGHTETGFWEVQGENGRTGEFNKIKVALTIISFPIRLATLPTETVLIQGNGTSASQEEKEKCPGEPNEPEAEAAGVLCLYTGSTQSGDPFSLLTAAPLKAGANLIFLEPEKAVGSGSWAIKAP